ncbi:MAG: signal peptidase I [Acidobacteriota bacterium]
MANSFIFKGKSMKGVFSYGDLLIIEGCEIGRLHPGDIIAFKDTGEKNKSDPISHRVIKKSKNSLITRGDNNRYPDTHPVTEKDLLGKITSFERKGKSFKVPGGIRNLYLARVKFFFRRSAFWIYKKATRPAFIRSTGSVILRTVFKNIKKINLNSKNAPISKWVLNKRTIAQKGPEKDFFYIKKPFDLIIKK